MSITTAVTRKLDNNCVQVEIKSDNDATRYYKVPEQKADDFQKEYVANSKKVYNYSSLLSFSSVLGASALALIFTKNIANKILRYGLSAVTGIVAGVITTISTQKAAIKDHKKFLQDYDASVIDYNNKKLPI